MPSMLDDTPPGSRTPLTPAITGADSIRPSLFGTMPAALEAATSGGAGGWLAQIAAFIKRILGGTNGDGTNDARPATQAHDLDIASVGDPHLSETGTLADGRTADVHYDSMTGHSDLVHAQGIDGGFRVSTAVTDPDPAGVTWNREATVHANWDQDEITMRNDGSVTITSDGVPVTVAAGAHATLAGGETVTRNADGSLVVSASDGNGGVITTTMRCNGRGVDVTTHAHDIAVGGDVVQPHRRPLVGVGEITEGRQAS